MNSDCASTPAKSVLLVDPSADAREVLRTVLERRGLRIFEADEPRAGLELMKLHQPHVIVLDGDARNALEAAESAETEQRWQIESLHPASLIILGTARLPSALPAGHVIAKPYHFAPLVHKIEQLAAKAA